MHDLIERQAAIDEIKYELKMINSALDSITLDFNTRERLRQRRGEAREILNSIQQLSPAQSEQTIEMEKQDIIRRIEDGIVATSSKDLYSCGMRNGMRWCKSLLDDKEPEYEDAQLERKTGEWIKYGIPRCGEQHYQCTACGYYINFGQWGEFYTKEFKYCPNCGLPMKRGV